MSTCSPLLNRWVIAIVMTSYFLTFAIGLSFSIAAAREGYWNVFAAVLGLTILMVGCCLELGAYVDRKYPRYY